MKRRLLILLVILGGVWRLSAPGEEPVGDAAVVEGKADLFEMDVLADGNYLVEMAQGGETILVNIEVSGGRLESVNCREAGLVGMQGVSTKLANGVFVVQLKNGSYAASQIRAFGAGGNGVVNENPNRGERHRVWRVESGEVLKLGAEK